MNHLFTSDKLFKKNAKHIFCYSNFQSLVNYCSKMHTYFIHSQRSFRWNYLRLSAYLRDLSIIRPPHNYKDPPFFESIVDSNQILRPHNPKIGKPTNLSPKTTWHNIIVPFSAQRKIKKDYPKKDSKKMSKLDIGIRNVADFCYGSRRYPRLNNRVEGPGHSNGPQDFIINKFLSIDVYITRKKKSL